MRALLRGLDHTQLGQVEVVDLAPDLAIGLTRGLHAKSYDYVDPNEDVVLARRSGDRTALVVADGHNGHQASHVAVTVLDRLLAEDLTGMDGRQAPIRALHAVNEAIRDQRRDLPEPARRTRTTLVAAVVEQGDAARTITTASIGDSVVIAVSPTTGARTLTRDRHRFLGDRSSLPEMAGATHLSTTALDDDEIVIIASDGLTNFARLDDIGPIAVNGDSPSEIVAALIDLAGAGGAGDNVAIAVMTPGPR